MRKSCMSSSCCSSFSLRYLSLAFRSWISAFNLAASYINKKVENNIVIIHPIDIEQIAWLQALVNFFPLLYILQVFKCTCIWSIWGPITCIELYGCAPHTCTCRTADYLIHVLFGHYQSINKIMYNCLNKRTVLFVIMFCTGQMTKIEHKENIKQIKEDKYYMVKSCL